ncbi:hypothetical protein [Dietzia sp.]|uniref:hypothetical protein n=1 Tax=Dietzia sp. TaxID=1871616 RepID=UPI002FDB24E0
MPLSMKLTLKLAGVTYGELYDYVAAAKAAGVPPEEEVRCVGSDSEGDRFEVDLEGRPGSVSGAAACGNAGGSGTAQGEGIGGAGGSSPLAIADALRKSLKSEADVDKVMSMLADMRKFFRK